MKPNLRVLLCPLFLLAVSALPQTNETNRASGYATLRISTTKTEYVLGEPVRLDMRFTQTGNFAGGLFEPTVSEVSGGVHVFIAPRNGEFRRYVFRGSFPGRRVNRIGRDYLYSNTIFFNSKPQTGHLSDYGRSLAERGMMLTDYAFPEPGEYRIKAMQGFSKAENGTVTAERVDSNEISITVKRPEGDDLRVWEIMKTDLRIGFFMTSGTIPSGSPWSRTEDSAITTDLVLAEVDRITSQYPNSYLAGLLKVKAQENRARQERYRLEEERRRQQKAANATKIN